MTSPDSFATLDAWLDWLPGLSSREIELGLERVAEVYERLDLPRPGRVFTVAGTNGKGSTVHMLQALLEARGESVGAYTSPHILRYEERIRVGGRPAEAEEIVAAFRAVESARRGIALTYFEFGTLAALSVFANRKVDSWVLEVGLGGRLDAVNVVDHDGCIVTNVSLDHREWLGDSVGEIAREKAGVMRPGRPAVFGARERPGEIEDAAISSGANLVVAGRDYAWAGESSGDWRWQGQRVAIGGLRPLAMPGDHQRDNAAAVLALLEASGLDDVLTADRVNASLAQVVVPGRQQRLSAYGRQWLLDGAHNEDGARALGVSLAALAQTHKICLVLGVLDDKDVVAIAAHLLPHVKRVVTLTADSPRAISAGRLKETLETMGNAQPAVPVIAAESPGAAFETACEQTNEDDLIVVAGSFYTLSLAYRWLGDTID